MGKYRQDNIDIDKANRLNDHFCSQAFVNDNNKTLHQQTSTWNNYNVRDVLNNINVTKACGSDLISPRLLNEGATKLSKPISIIFNCSLLQGYLPSNWKGANVTVIYKIGRKIYAIKLHTNISSKSNGKSYGKMYPQTSLQLHIRKQHSYTISVWFYSR